MLVRCILFGSRSIKCIACVGHYFLMDDHGARIPVLHSTVGYMGIPDGGDPRGTQSLWAWRAGVVANCLGTLHRT